MLSREVRALLANAVGFAPSQEDRRPRASGSGSSVNLVNPGEMAPPDGSSPAEPQPGASNAAPPPNEVPQPQPNEVPFESVDNPEENQPKVATKVGIWSCQYDPEDLKLWFAMMEDQLTMLGVTSQYLKRMALAKVLPPDVKKAAAPLLRLKWHEAKADDNLPYLKVKTFIMDTFGPKDEDLVDRLNRLRMSAKPSELGHQLIELVCSSKLVGCTCCAKLVHSFWISKMPENIKAAIAGSPKFGEDSYVDTFRLADAVWQATRSPNPAVAAASITSQEDDSGEVAALKGSSKPKGQGQGQKSGDKPADKKPPKGICKNHLKFGTDTRKCAGPSWCALANCIVNPQIQFQA